MLTRILIADDEELERRALRMILSGMSGWEIECVEVANGRQAVEAARSMEIHIALLDVRMPGMDGIVAARELRMLHPEIRLIFVTAFDSFDYAREALRLGVDEYLVKPADPESVRSTVSRALEKLQADKAERERRVRAGTDSERALALLEQELRSAIARDEVVGSRLDSFLTLRGYADGERLAVVIRPGETMRRSAVARSANARRLSTLAEQVLREEGWYAIGGADDAEARLAAAAPHSEDSDRNERVRKLLARIAEESASTLALRVRIGAAPSFPLDGPELFSAAQDAASLARGSRPIVFLAPDSDEMTTCRDVALRGGGLIVERALEYLRAHMAENLSLADVSDAVSCSSFHLSRLFRVHLGDTFVHAFTRLRIDAAKALLRTGQYSVKEAGAFVGFDDQAYFARVFRKMEGLSPAEFRDNPDSSARLSAT